MVTARLSNQSSDPPQPATSRLFEPSHQNRLRVVGRALDEMNLEQTVILDLGDSILLRDLDPATGALISESFQDADLPMAMQAVIYGRNSAEPSDSQASALRALGYRLDRQLAEAIAIVECPRYMHVSGMERIGSDGDTVMIPFCYLYEALRVNSLVNEAVSRRERSSLTGGLSAQSIDTGQLGRVMHSSGTSRAPNR